MLKLIPDTNFLIYLSEYKLLDKLEDYELILLKQILEELVSISKGNRENKKARESAELALMFLKKSDCKLIKNIDGKADDAIVEFAGKNEKNYLVGTMDQELIKRLKEKDKNIKILIVRQKKFLKTL